MFYAHFVLAKKGPLARIWLAAHWDKKLTKAHVFETNIEKSVDGILQPKVKMALRTSGHLLLGVVRIYSRKAKYLLADCNEAFVKIKMAFRPGMVDLPEDIREAAVSAITFPEVFHDFDTPMPELNDVDIQAQFSLNQSRAEEITMREDYGNISLVTGDDGFGDIGFEEPPELMRATSGIDQNMDHTDLMFDDNMNKERDLDSSKEQNSRLENVRTNGALDLEAPIRGDGFGGSLGQDIIAGSLFESSLFDDAPMGEAPPLDSGQIDKDAKPQDESDDDDGGDIDQFGGPPSVGPPSSDGGSPQPMTNLEPEDDVEAEVNDVAQAAEGEAAQDQTTLMRNEEESFALAPVDATVIKSGWPRTKRKRKLIVDEVKNISGEEMKSQLSDTTDIVTTLDLAPPSKRLMHWKETGGVEKLFALPGRYINATVLSKIYIRNLTSEYSHNEDFGLPGDKEIDNLRLEQVGGEEEEAPYIPRPRGRPPKRRLPESELNAIHKPTEEVVSPPMNKSGEESFNELIASKKPREEIPVQEEAPAIEEEPLHSPAPADLHHDDDHESDEAPPPAPEVPADVPETPVPDAPTQEAQDESAAPPDLTINEATPEKTSIPPPPTDAFSPVPDDDGVDLEEQADDETYEEFEERVVNKRAGLMFHSIKKSLRTRSLNFSEFSKGQSRKVVAQRFYTMLVLKKVQAVELMQDGPYAEIVISKGGLFENAKL